MKHSLLLLVASVLACDPPARPSSSTAGGAAAATSTPIDTPSAEAQCDLESVNEYGRPSAVPQVYSAALRFFLVHTARGGPHALGPDLERERSSFVFANTRDSRSGRATQLMIDEMAVRWPRSVKVPLTRPLRPAECYDEVYLDLTEQGRYLVIVEQATFTPVYMYFQSYRP